MLDVSIIIVNYKSYEELKNCLTSIYKHTKDIIFEIIIVDNHPEENKITSIQKKFPYVKIIKSPQNLGFGKANNIGCSNAQGRFYFFLNPDTILLNNAILILYSYMKSNPNVGVCGGNLYTKEGSINKSYEISLPRSLDSLLYLLNLSLPSKQLIFNLEKPQKVAWIMGANMFVDKFIFDNIGRFEKRFFMYFEEVDISIRMQKAGYESHFVPDAKIIHLEGSSSKKSLNENMNIHYINSFMEFNKIHNPKTYICLYIVLSCKIFLAKCYFHIRKNNMKLSYWRKIYNLRNNTQL